MTQECPVKTDREAPLALRHIGKRQTDIVHHCLPMFAAIRMKLKFLRNDHYVLDGIIKSAQGIRKTFVPLFAIG